MPAQPPNVFLAEIAEEHITNFGALTEPGRGVTRLGYTALERKAHALYAEHMRSLGLLVREDAAGNTIAELPSSLGQESAGIGTGSHLDSVPGGGRFDGIAGVVAAMMCAEAALLIDEVRNRPWRFVVFATEEGARFGQACNGSRAIAGVSTIADLTRLVDEDGTTMRESMILAGLDPDQLPSAKWSQKDWHAFVELHIEQGNVLETEGVPIGVVHSISGSTRLEVHVTGQATHTGGTPMRLRRDALVTAAACILAGDELAQDHQHHGTRITVGRLEVSPGAITTVPGAVTFTVDIRDVDSDRQRQSAAALAARYEQLATQHNTHLEMKIIGDTSPVLLPDWVARKTIGAAESLGQPHRMLTSGASHDSQYVNQITPTGMIFIPSIGGLSHVPEESSSFEDLAIGARLLFETMRRLDSTL